MRKVMSLMLIISGLSVGCGDSDKDTSMSPVAVADAGDDGANGNGNGNGNGNQIPIPEDASAGGEPEPLYPMCDRAAAAMSLGPAGAKWTGPAPFTMSQLDACLKLCPMGEFSCIQAMCENGMAFYDCFNDEVGACAAVGNDALCKTEWENLGCCAKEKKCNLGTQEGATACVGGGGPCATDLSNFQTCSSGCQQAAQRVCVSADPVGGGTGGGATGAATGGTTTTTTLPAKFVSGLIQAQF